MKKVLKIIVYVLLALVLIFTGAIVFFNRQYNLAKEELTASQQELSNAPKTFYQFELRKDSLSELTMLPTPKSLEWTAGQFKWPENWEVSATLPQVNSWVDRLFGPETSGNSQRTSMNFTENKALAPEGYELSIKPSEIHIAYSTEAGAYYALVSLFHLKKQYPEVIKCLTIKDEPDLVVRGLMLDISRDKVPQLHTLKELIHELSLLKYNHLQLYVEGFSFGYPSFKELWEETETPISPEEIQELDLFCKERFIALVPNQNSLGHMQAWLETEAYAHLAECPDGYELMPMNKVKTTLDPTNPESIALIEKMMDDMIPNFSSDIFNANFGRTL